MAKTQTTTNLSLVLPGTALPGITNTNDAISQIVAALKAIDTAWTAKAMLYAADTGVANALAAAPSPAPTLAAGLAVLVKAAHANTGATTLALNGGAAKAVQKDGSALSGGEIAAAGQICLFVYDGTAFQLVSI